MMNGIEGGIVSNAMKEHEAQQIRGAQQPGGILGAYVRDPYLNNAPRERATLGASLAEIDKACEALSKQTESLEIALQPVLRPSPREGIGGVTSGDSDQAPLVAYAQSIVRRLMFLSDRVGELRSRLEC